MKGARILREQTRDFLRYFGEIEKELGKITGLDNGRHFAFYEKVEEASKKLPVIRRFETELKTFGDLRNLLSHNNASDIAVPSVKTVKRIETIWRNIAHPVTSMEMAHKDVVTLRDTDLLVDVLAAVDEKEFTHFPVYRGKEFLGLLTDNGITFWLARHRKHNSLTLDDVQIKDILDKDEKRQNYRFVSRKQSIFEVDDYFGDPLMEALFVTENGKKSETILGIITGWDVLSHQINGD